MYDLLFVADIYCLVFLHSFWFVSIKYNTNQWFPHKILFYSCENKLKVFLQTFT